jgi:hypothetical protein
LSLDECAKLQRLLDRYRDLLATAKDELLRRGILSQIESLEEKLRDCVGNDEEPQSDPAGAAPPRPAPRA